VNTPFNLDLAVRPQDLPGVSALTPIRFAHAADQVADRLVTSIALGEFATGERLPQVADLAALLSVNQASIREAIQSLAENGYLRIVRGRNGGAYVANCWGPDAAEIIRRVLLPNWEAFEALFDLRRLLEPLIAWTAATRHNGDDAAAIRAACEAYVDACEDREAARASDQALHTAIASATHNRYLVTLSLQIRARVSLGFQGEPYSRAIRRRAIDQHALLVNAILARDGERAAQVADEHFAMTEDVLRGLYERVREAGDSQSRVAGGEAAAR
jgi:DNA-binding FadR family transcriptional regulator